MEGVQTYKSTLMPYITRVLGWIQKGAKYCTAIHSRTDEWEVDTADDRLIVNQRTRTCTCNHFMLTGIPCSHAWSCIVAKRERPADYVDQCYNKETYTKAYSSHVKPMPGYKHWDACDNPEPLQTMWINATSTGRPSLKKRRKEDDEVEKGQGKKVKRQGRNQKCSNCGEYGHKNYKGKCKKPKVAPAAKSPKKGGRPASNDAWVLACKKKKEIRANMV